MNVNYNLSSSIPNIFKSIASIDKTLDISAAHQHDNWICAWVRYSPVHTLSTDGLTGRHHLCTSPVSIFAHNPKSELWPLFWSYWIFCVGCELLPLPKPADHWFWVSLGGAAEQSASPFLRLHILGRGRCEWRRGCGEREKGEVVNITIKVYDI